MITFNARTFREKLTQGIDKQLQEVLTKKHLNRLEDRDVT